MSDAPTKTDKKLRATRLVIHALASVATPLVFGTVVSQLHGVILYAAWAVAGLYGLDILLAIWVVERRPPPRTQVTAGAVLFEGADAERVEELLEALRGKPASSPPPTGLEN